MAGREGTTRTLLSFPWIFRLSSESRNPSHNALQVRCGICLPPRRAGKVTIGLSSSSSPRQVDLLARQVNFKAYLPNG